MSNVILYKLNNSIPKYKLIHIILHSKNLNIAIIDPGNLITYLGEEEKIKLRNRINCKYKNNSFFFHYFFSKLITFSKDVLYKFKSYEIYDFINNNKLNTIGVHIRLGKYGDFHENNGTYFANLKSLYKFNNTISLLVYKYNISFIFLSSDSSFIANSSNKKLIVIRNIIKSTHIKHSNNWYFKSLNIDSIECLLEFYALIKANYLVLTKNSAFSNVVYYMNKNCLINRCYFISQ